MSPSSLSPSKPVKIFLKYSNFESHRLISHLSRFMASKNARQNAIRASSIINDCDFQNCLGNLDFRGTFMVPGVNGPSLTLTLKILNY